MAQAAKNLPANTGDLNGAGSTLGSIGKMPYRMAWQPTPARLPRGSHGQRTLVGDSPQARKESDTTGAT